MLADAAPCRPSPTSLADDWKTGLAAVIERLNAIHGQISDLNNQQQAHHVAIQRLERAGNDNAPHHGGCDADSDSFTLGHGGDGCHGDRPPCYHKLDFPKFDRKGDPIHFLNRCEQFYRGPCTLKEEKVWLAFYHLLDGTHHHHH
uniref:Uncharacterized protein n=1 Tax=Oryza rufipogon TaxID=4529 RepID=A0A0E0N2U0_ORYRU